MTIVRKEFCKNGHPRIPENLTTNRTCKICNHTRNHTRTKESRESERKKYYENHKEEINEYNKKYYENHKEELNERGKKYYENHKEERRECDKKYHETHKDKIREYGQKNRLNLSETYIANRIGLPVNLLREEMKNKLKKDVDIFEIKREAILLTRQLRGVSQ